MRGIRQSGALLRSTRVISRAVSSLEETTVAPFSQHIDAYRQASYPSLSRSRCSPPCASRRHFSHTPVAGRKKQRDPSERTTTTIIKTSSSSDGPSPNPEEPFNFADVEYAFAKGTYHYLNELTKARSGGRFNPDILGQLRVRPDKKLPQTFPLHELAAIVPKHGSRKVSILVHELANVKPVMTAIQASPDFNQQPQRVEDNEQELVLTVEAEDPEETAKRLKDILTAWRVQVRDAKHRRETAAKNWLRDNKIVRDDFKRHEEELQKLQDKKMAEIKAKEKEILGKSR